jgi:hypothetical protein
MHRYYCSIAMTSIVGGRGQTLSISRRVIDVSSQVFSPGMGRFEEVLFLGTVCHHLSCASGRFPGQHHLAGDEAWIAPCLMAPERHLTALRGDWHANSDVLSSPSPSHAWALTSQHDPIHTLAEDQHAGAGTLGYLLYRELPSPRWRRLRLAMLTFCIVAFACAVAGAVLYLH